MPGTLCQETSPKEVWTDLLGRGHQGPECRKHSKGLRVRMGMNDLRAVPHPDFKLLAPFGEEAPRDSDSEIP